MVPRAGRQGAAPLVAALVALSLLVLPGAADSSVGENEDVGLNPWWFDALNIAKADEQTRGEGVTIAVIDAAINLEAADLQGADITLEPGRGPDGRTTSCPDALSAGHGTSVTTVIAGQGRGTNGPGVVGVAPDAKIFSYQVDPDPYDDRRLSTAEDVDQAVRDGADLINLSFGATRPCLSRGPSTRGWLPVKRGTPSPVGKTAR